MLLLRDKLVYLLKDYWVLVYCLLLLRNYLVRTQLLLGIYLMLWLRLRMTDTKLLSVLKFLLMFFLAVTIDSNKDEYNSNRHANNDGDIFGSA